DVFHLGGAGDLTLSGAVTGSTTTAPLVKIGAGTLTLANAGNNYAGGTRIDAGTLRLGAANVLPNTGTVTLNGGTLSTGAAAGFLARVQFDGYAAGQAGFLASGGNFELVPTPEPAAALAVAAAAGAVFLLRSRRRAVAR